MDVFDQEDDFFDDAWTNRRDAAFKDDPELSAQVEELYEASHVINLVPLYDHELETSVLTGDPKPARDAYDEAVDVWIDALTYVANEASGTYTLPDGVAIDVGQIARADASFVAGVLLSQISAHADILAGHVANEPGA